MKFEKTVLVHFVSKFIAVVIGFFGTVYFARTVGAGTLGTYFLILGVIMMLNKLGSIGVRTATTKYLSEDQDPSYVAAGFTVQLGIYILLSIGIVVLRRQINQYVGTEIAYTLLFLLFLRVSLSMLYGILDGEKKVHVSSVISSTETITRTGIQAAGVYFGYKLTALLFGYTASMLAAIVTALYFVSVRVVSPTFKQIRNLLNYVKYAWLGGARSVSFAWMDTLVLGLFVSNNLIGVYEIAWMASSLLAILGNAISRVLLPEISSKHAQDRDISGIMSKSVGYAGFLLIPGIVGGFILGKQFLLIYGAEFVAGYHILVILMLARLIYAYQQQYLTGLNAVNRPDLSFRTSGAFLIINIILNFSLISLIGWTGAAIATAVSAGVGFVISNRYISKLVNVQFPLSFIGKQCLAASVMGGCLIGATQISSESLPVLITLVGVGAAIYLGLLSVISDDFRTVLLDNFP